MSDRLRVFVLYERDEDLRPYSHSHIRLLRPLSHPTVADRVELSYGPHYEGEPVDVVVVDRLWRPEVTPEMFDAVADRARAAGARVVHAIDDDLLTLARELPDALTVDEADALERLARRADRLVVTTERLRQRMAPLNDDIRVVANALDERLLVRGAPPPRPDGTVVIGAMGTWTHEADLALILPALAELERVRPQVRFELVGFAADRDGVDAGPRFRRRLPPAAETEYPLFMPWFTSLGWDIGLGPLIESEFTAAKSDIKVLDYAALGAAGVFSDVPAYRDSVADGHSGRLVPNNLAAWLEALLDLVDDAEARRRLATEARRRLWTSRVLRVAAPEFVEALHVSQPVGRPDP